MAPDGEGLARPGTPSPALFPSGYRLVLELMIGRPSKDSTADALKIACGMVILSALSWPRYLATGTLNLSEFRLSTSDWTWFAPLFAAAFILAGRAAIRVAVYGTSSMSRRRIVRLALIINAAAATS